MPVLCGMELFGIAAAGVVFGGPLLLVVGVIAMATWRRSAA